MPINPALLIAAPILQDIFVEKDGTPMSNGTITCYQDNSRTTLKNWYYQSGTPGNYTYIRLPNPLSLSAAGTICDINGVDTIPFFYPYDETDQTTSQPYYITIVNYAQTNQITRANFPYNRSTASNTTEIETINNLIINNGFWRNRQPNYINQPFTSITLNTYAAADNTVSVVVAPSQHDGFSMPDIRFIKNNVTGTDTLTFTPFPASDSPVIVQSGITYTTPEYYINHQCTGVGTDESEKCYQFPIALHLNNLANIPFTASIQAQWGSSGSNVIQLNLLQFTGTGTTSPSIVVIGGTTITLTTQWQNYVLTEIFPSLVGLTLGLGEDDAFYLQVQLPLNTTCSINFTKPSIYLTTEAIPVNDFLTYDQVDSVINSPRTGDVRTSMNDFYYFGWLPMNNGLMGRTNPGTNISYVRANSDNWPLFNLLWTKGKPYDSGINFNPLFQMWSNTAGTLAATNYGTTAYGDFIATAPALALALPYSMGRVLMGTVPIEALLSVASGYTGNKVAVTASNGTPAILFTYAPAAFLQIFLGAPLTFTGTLPDAIVANAVYYAIPVSTSTFNIATTFANAMAGTKIAYGTTTGSGVIVNLFPTGAIEGEYAHTQLLNEMVDHTHDPLSPSINFVTGTGLPGGAYTTTGANAGTLASKTGNVTTHGTQVGFNVTQPATLMNIFIKL